MDIIPTPAHAHDEAAAPVAPQDVDDFEDWIDGVQRPTKEVPLFNALSPEDQLRWTAIEAELTDAQDVLARAKRDAEAGLERSVTDPGITGAEEAERVALEKVQAFREAQLASARIVTVTQITPDERTVGEREGLAAGLEPGWAWLHWAAERTTFENGKHPTPQQLQRLATRDVSGHQQVLAIKRGIEGISAVPSVPTWPGSSTSRAGRTSSGS